MLGVGFLYFFAMWTIVAAIYLLIAYAFPGTTPGKIAAVIRG